ncbi:hypothetical protein SERLA73DRAFT_192370, partial [Serpula lacrymans var. lacrymans S7.3]
MIQKSKIIALQMNVLLEKKELEPPVHHLVQIRQFHGLTNGLVMLDHLIKRGGRGV